MGSFLCLGINLLFDIPQAVFDLVFGIFGLTAPDLTAGVGSIFGCNL